MKYIIVNQRFGIGDVIFSMTAIRALNALVTIWPVLPEYVDGLREAYGGPGSGFIFVDFNLFKIDYSRKDRYFVDGAEVIPLAHQDIPLIDCMKNKYAYFGMDWHQWKTEAMWKRNEAKEKSLIEYLGIKDGEQFYLTNVNWGCHSSAGFKSGTNQANMDMPFPSDHIRRIRLDFVTGYSLFDWAAVIEKATYIYSVSTSLLYLLELLTLQA